MVTRNLAQEQDFALDPSPAYGEAEPLAEPGRCRN